jgi:hypothetical protein
MNTYVLASAMLSMLFSLIFRCFIPRNTLGFLQFIPLIVAGVSAGAKAIKASQQRREARKLKESTYMPPELAMNRDLAQLQAYSRRAPGQAKAEENIRRAQANTLSAIERSAGGSADKVAAGAIGSQLAAQEGIDQANVRGQQFSENAFGRIQPR